MIVGFTKGKRNARRVLVKMKEHFGFMNHAGFMAARLLTVSPNMKRMGLGTFAKMIRPRKV